LIGNDSGGGGPEKDIPDLMKDREERTTFRGRKSDWGKGGE